MHGNGIYFVRKSPVPCTSGVMTPFSLVTSLLADLGEVGTPRGGVPYEAYEIRHIRCSLPPVSYLSVEAGRRSPTGPPTRVGSLRQGQTEGWFGTPNVPVDSITYRQDRERIHPRFSYRVMS
jgi:hypothetical protein